MSSLINPRSRSYFSSAAIRASWFNPWLQIRTPNSILGFMCPKEGSSCGKRAARKHLYPKSELKALLDEERYQRKEDREKTTFDLKTYLLKAKAEALEDLKRRLEAGLRR